MTPSHEPDASQSLAKAAVFADLGPDVLSRIERCCSWRRYGPGEPIVDYLDTSGDVFFIAAGEARASIYSLLGKGVIFCRTLRRRADRERRRSPGRDGSRRHRGIGVNRRAKGVPRFSRHPYRESISPSVAK